MAFTQSEFSLTEGLTKVKNNASLFKTLVPCRLDSPIQQWIIRNARGDYVVEEVGVCQWINDVS